VTTKNENEIGGNGTYLGLIHAMEKKWVRREEMRRWRKQA
jgi:hypothetical protein